MRFKEVFGQYIKLVLEFVNEANCRIRKVYDIKTAGKFSQRDKAVFIDCMRDFLNSGRAEVENRADKSSFSVFTVREMIKNLEASDFNIEVEPNRNNNGLVYILQISTSLIKKHLDDNPQYGYYFKVIFLNANEKNRFKGLGDVNDTYVSADVIKQRIIFISAHDAGYKV